MTGPREKLSGNGDGRPPCQRKRNSQCGLEGSFPPYPEAVEIRADFRSWALSGRDAMPAVMSLFGVKRTRRVTDACGRELAAACTSVSPEHDARKPARQQRHHGSGQAVDETVIACR
jgi:hypothetical protein